MRKPRLGRKLLVASIGVAAVNYAACGQTTVANLAPPPQDGSVDAPKDSAVDAPKDSAKDAPLEAIVANLAPPPVDSGLGD